MIQKRAASQPPRGVIVLVHGLCQGSWCWDEGFLKFFSEEGYDCYAIDLHRKNENGQSASIDDYVCQLRGAVEEVGGDPILVGHSMGGFVVQKYLEKYACKKVILITPVPPQGALLPTLRVILRHPSELVHLPTGNLRAVLSNRYSELFHPETDVAIVDKYRKQLVQESFRAFVGMCWRRVRARRDQSVKMLVIGASHDGLMAKAEVVTTAQKHGADLEVMEGVGHNLMLEPGGEVAANKICVWLASAGE